MNKKKKILFGFLALLCGLALAFLLWRGCGGPERMARRTAERYLETHAPEYGFVGEVSPGTTEHGLLGAELVYPNWTITGQTDAENWDRVVRMELAGGWFPWRVAEASWWTSEAGRGEPLPID